jgi:hypothetical protein
LNLEEKFALAEGRPEGGFVRVDDQLFPDLFVGSSAGCRVLMLIADYQPPEPPNLAFIRSEIRRRDDQKWLLLISLQRRDLRQLFSHLVTDLVQVTGRAPRDEAPNALVTRLAHWQKLLSRSPSGVLEDHELRGLLAELRFLHADVIPARQITAAVDAWKGPDRRARDFRFADVEVELKALTRTSKSVGISSISQLSDAGVPVRLATVVVELFDDPQGGQAVADFIAQLRNVCAGFSAALELLNNKLAAAGYIDLPAYSERYVSFGQTLFYAVGMDFPRLNRMSVHPGIVDATYDIAIQAIENFKIPNWTS